MSEAKFTPGPWMIKPRNISHNLYAMLNVEAMDHAAVCSVTPRLRGDKSCQMGEANAHLIAAAPDMYEALERLMSELPTRRDWLDPVTEQMAKSALAKARGEAR